MSRLERLNERLDDGWTVVPLRAIAAYSRTAATETALQNRVIKAAALGVDVSDPGWRDLADKIIQQLAP